MKRLVLPAFLVPTPVLAHEWMLRELCRNLLHNAIRHTPEHGALNVTLQIEDDDAVLA